MLKSQSLTFDESYCHSAGNADAKIYEIKKNTTEIRFTFPDINAFWSTYFIHNQYLPQELKQAVVEHNALFTVQLIQDSCAYIFADDMRDEIVLNAKTLQLSQGKKKFEVFSHGILGIGIFSGTPDFAVLWATMYRS